MYIENFCPFCVLNFTLHFFKCAKINYLTDQLEHTHHFLGENFAYRDMKSVQIHIFPLLFTDCYYLQPLKKKECGFPTGLIIYFFDGRSPARNTPTSVHSISNDFSLRKIKQMTSF